MNRSAKLAAWIAVLLGAMASQATLAQEATEQSSASSGSGMDFSFSGMIRSETAFSTGDANPLNQRGNVYNGKEVTRVGAPGGAIYVDTTTRNGQPDNPDLNMQMFRAQLEATMKFNESWSAVAKLHALFDPGWYSEFDPGKIGSNAAGELYGKPNYFDYVVEGKSHSTPLEWTGENYQVYFPALFLEYNHGPLDIRLGNQQIAWGQAIFFRVLDIPDGLDLRRHSVLDYVPEEFSDKRVPTLALRTTYQFANQWMADAYVSQFRPSVLPNPNNPYNAIASQFTIHDRYADYDNNLDFGIRLKGDLGNFGLQGVFARRYNPDGVYRWTRSGVNRDIPGLPGTGAVLAETPFEVDSSGVWSSQEWFDYAARSRLDGVGGLNSAIRDFPASALLGAFEAPNYDIARLELDTFFQLAGGLLVGQNNGGLRGHLERKYDLETNIGAGMSYVFSGDPGSFTDQLIMNVEALYTPDRVFTDPALSKEFITKDELVAALVLEKYQRFSSDLPATYMVGQVLHKTQSDIFGRYLGGYDATVNHTPDGKSGGYTAVAFAFQQPFANLIWRADLAILYDLGGGLLVQPAVRWKPNGTFTMEAFYNYLNGTIGGNPNKNALSSADYADEIAVRIGMQF